ncbi:MAG: hypothetical protein ACK41D_07035 [Rubricoccaceae bacterium]
MYDVTGSAAPLAHSLLLVDGRAEQLAGALEHYLGAVQVTPCTSSAAARAYLSGTHFTGMLVSDVLPDGSGIEVVRLCRMLAPHTEVLVRITPGADSHEAFQAGASSVTACLPEPGPLSAFVAEALGIPAFPDAMSVAMPAGVPRPAAAALLDEVRGEMARVAHALNNPLAVIHGNAQYVLELARALDLDEAMVAPVRDIEEAGGRLSELFGEITALRQRIDAAMLALQSPAPTPSQQLRAA